MTDDGAGAGLIRLRGAASSGALVFTFPLATLEINTAMVRIRASFAEDTIYRSEGGWVEHGSSWFRGDAVRLVDGDGTPKSLWFAGSFRSVVAALAANGWPLHERQPDSR